MNNWGLPLGAVTVGQEVMLGILSASYFNPFFYSTYQFFLHQYRIEGDTDLEEVWPTVMMYLFLFGTCAVLNWNMIDDRDNRLIPVSIALSQWDSNLKGMVGQITINSTWSPEVKVVKGTITYETDWAVMFKANQNNLPIFYPYKQYFDMIGLRLDALDKDLSVGFKRVIFGLNNIDDTQIHAQFKHIFDSKNLSGFGLVKAGGDATKPNQFFDIAQIKMWDIPLRQNAIVESMEDIMQFTHQQMGIPVHATEKKERNISNEFKYNDAYQLVMKNSTLVYLERGIKEFNTKFKRNARIICTYDELLESQENEGKEQETKGYGTDTNN